jgi:hypothetical protein
MFGDIAVQLLKLMGHRGTIPSAINSEDIPEALQRLRDALDKKELEAKDTPTDDQEPAEEFIDQPVSLRSRAFPLIELLEAAAAEDQPVMWETR